MKYIYLFSLKEYWQKIYYKTFETKSKNYRLCVTPQYTFAKLIIVTRNSDNKLSTNTSCTALEHRAIIGCTEIFN